MDWNDSLDDLISLNPEEVFGSDGDFRYESDEREGIDASYIGSLPRAYDAPESTDRTDRPLDTREYRQRVARDLRRIRRRVKARGHADRVRARLEAKLKAGTTCHTCGHDQKYHHERLETNIGPCYCDIGICTCDGYKH